MTVGELYGRATPGTDAVQCYLCGRETEVGWAGAPSSAFTAWSGCLGGNGHCEFCRTLLKERQFRFYSWVLTPGRVQIADKEHRSVIWDTLLDPPEGMWAIYQTVGGQKQGWVPIASGVNEGRLTYWAAVDWLDRPVMMQLAYVVERAPVIDALRGAEVTKTSLCSGSWSVRDWNRAEGAGLQNEYQTAVTEAGKPEWEVLVNAHCRTA